MKRVLALLGAVALVAGAFALRSALDDDSTNVGTDDGPPVDDGSPLVVACIPELEAACDRLVRVDELRVEDPAETIAAIEDGEDIDAWVTLDPWPAIAQITASRDQFFTSNEQVVASSELRLLVRTGGLPATCSPPTWTCLVENTDRRVFVPDLTSATGPLVLGFAAVDFFGPGLATNDLQDRPLGDFLRALQLEVDDPVEEMLLPLGNAGPVATGATAADIEARIAATPRAGDFDSFPGTTPAAVGVVIVGPAAERIAGEPTFAQGLGDLGWSTDSPSRTTGLPSAGALFALSEEVS